MKAENEEDKAISLKVVVVGEKGCGKSTLLKSIENDTFALGVNDVHVNFKLQNTSGADLSVDERKKVYAGADLVIICCAKDNQKSFKNIETLKEEAREVVPAILFYLMRTKSDLDNEVVSIESL